MKNLHHLCFNISQLDKVGVLKLIGFFLPNGFNCATLRPRARAFALLSLVLCSVPLIGDAQTWFNTSWTYRKSITIDYTKVGTGPHTNFPVLISITDASLQANALSTGNDILFTSSNGTTKLDHQIESYNSATGTLVAWVEVPSLSSTANTVLYMYYGNASAANQQNASGVWDATFKGVYHLNGAYSDATANAYTGINTGTTSIAGKIGNGAGFDASNGADYITINGMMGSPASLTLSAWAYLTTYGSGNASEVISMGDKASIYMTSTGTSGFFYDGSSWLLTSTSTNLSGAWHYLTYTFTSGGTSQKIYVDGTLVTSTANAGAISYTGLGANTLIGIHGNGATTRNFTGTIDEVRVASSARSAGWIQTEYNNQNSPGTFYSIGACESKVPTVTTPVAYCQNATATQLTATGTNLLWNSGSTTGAGGGTGQITTTTTYTDNAFTNQKTNFSTLRANVTIKSVDVTIPAWQGITGMALGIFNSSGTLLATSATQSVTASGSATTVTFPINYTISTAGSYSIGLASGYGNVGGDVPTFPITEATSTISVTGKSSSYRCFNNIQFDAGGTTTAPTPSTTTVGTTNYTVTQAPIGCLSSKATIAVNVTGPVVTPTFSLGASSTRCPSAGTVTYTATASNSTGITYSLDATSTAAGNTINSSTAAVTYAASWSGTSTITASAAGCSGPKTATHIVTTVTPLSLSTSSTLTCYGGGSSGTITATASGGVAPYTYSINGGTYGSSNTFTGLAAGSYTIAVQGSAGCTASTSQTVSTYIASPDNQTTTSTDSWVGHVYDGTGFTTYIGNYTEAESFNQSFGGSTTCFNVSSNGGISSIYTETFSVKYRMNSTKRGLYTVNLGSDDGSRLTVDTTVVYSNWADQSFSTKSNVLMSLTGSSSLLYEFYENSGSNQVIYQSPTLVLANTLSANTTQSICMGNTGAAISGDTLAATLPTGISKSGTGYQWTYSTTPTGTRTAITGATGTTFTPSTSVAPFNTPGTYYIYRNVALSSTNNVSPNPYVATNESNAATITVNAVPSATISYSGSPYCASYGFATVTRTGTAGGSYSSTTGLSINASTGTIDLALSSVGTYTVTYTVNVGGCSTYTTTTSVHIRKIIGNAIDYTNGSHGTVCTTVSEGATATLTALAGTVFSNVGFASYGSPTGSCATSWAINSTCHASTSQTVAESYLLGNNSGAIPATNTIFTDPCLGTAKTFAVQATYTQTLCSGTTAGTIVGSTPTGGSGTYTYLWESSTTSATSGFAAASGTNNVKDYTAGALTQTTWFRRTVTSGSCSDVSRVVQITVVPAPSATISYAGSPYAATSGTATVTLTGTTGGTFSSTAGLSINATTGDINIAASTPGTYTVTYTIAAATRCNSFSTTTSVTLRGPTLFRSVVSGTWSTPATWESSLDGGTSWTAATIAPATTSDTVTISAGHTVTVSANVAPQLLTVSATGILLPSSASVLISGSGTLTGGGTVKVLATGNSAGDFVAQYTIANKTLTNLTVEFAGAATQYIGALTFNNLTINNSAGITLSGSPTVNGVLALTAGRVTLGAYNFNLGMSATVAGTPSATAMLVPTSTGEVRKLMSAIGSFTFPVGDNTGTAEYSPATVNVTGGTFAAGAYVSMRVVNAKQPNLTATTNYLNRYWVDAVSGITSVAYTIACTYVVADVVGTESQIYGARYRSWTTPYWNSFSATNTTTHQFTSSSIGDVGSFTGSEENCGIHDFRSLATGNWNTVGSWEVSTDAGTTWSAAGVYPLSSLDTVLIQPAHTITGNVSAAPLLFTINGIYTPSATAIISGTGSLTGTGTLKVTRTTATADFNTQYSITNKTISGLTVDYSASAAQTVNGLTYNNLTISGSGTKTASGNVVVNGALTIGSGITLSLSTYTLSGTLATIANSGTIVTLNTSATPLPSGKTWGGTIDYKSTTGGQTIVAATYNNLSNSNTSGTNTAGGALTVNGTLTLNTSSVLDMGANALSGTLTTRSGTGTLKTQNTSTTPIPAGLTWPYTVEYNAATGGQTIVAGTYTNLTNSNTSGTNAAAGAVNVNGLLTLNTSSVLDMGVNALAGTMTTTAGTGYLKTQSTSLPAIPTGVTWLGTVEYNGATGGQTISGGTYTNLVNSNASGTNTAGAALTITGNFTSSGGTFAGGTYTHLLGGNWTMSSGSFANSGTTITLNGTGAQTINSVATFNNLTINKASGSTTLLSNVSVGGVLTFTLGSINAGSYTLIIPNGGSISGASQNTGWVIGNLQKYFSVATGSLEVGCPNYYTPLSVSMSGFSTPGSLIVKAVNAQHPSIASSNLAKSINRYWTISVPASGYLIASSAIFTYNWNAVDNYSGINSSLLKVGMYSNGAWSYPVVSGTSTTTSIQAGGVNNIGDFTVGEQCLTTANFSYTGSPYCSNGGTATVTLGGTSAAGTFTATPAGLSINSAAGVVTLASSTPGTYTVTNTISGSGCNSSATATININQAPSATTSYAGTPYCSNAGIASVTLTGTAGGTFTSTAGLVIDANTGDITLASCTPGTYTVTYTVPASAGCAQFTTTTSITITASPSATISYAGSPYCSSAGTATVTRTGTAGGTYSSTTGLAISAATGDITLGSSTPGTYTVTYTVPAANGCAIFSTTASITITQQPLTNGYYAGSPYCSNAGTASPTATVLLGAAGYITSSPSGISVDGYGNVNLGASTPGTYTLTYTVPAYGGCATYNYSSGITITAAPSATISYAGNPFCTSSGVVAVTRTGTAGGIYSSTAGLSINATTGAVTPATSTPGTYTVTYTIAAANGCAQYTTTTNVVITAQPSATISYAGSPYNTYGSATVTQTGTTGGIYSSTAGLSIDSLSGAINLGTSTPGTYTVTYKIAASGGCTQYQTTASVTIRATYNFRSITSGAWDSVTTWEVSSNGGSTWTSAIMIPTQATDTVLISSGHTVAVHTSINPSLLTVSTGAVLSPDSAISITGTGTLTGTGTVQTTKAAGFSSQYTIANKNLAALTVDYAGLTPQNVSALSYYNLTVSNISGAAMAQGNLSVSGTLNVATGAIFNGSTYTISGTGTLAGSGTAAVGMSGNTSGDFAAQYTIANKTLTNLNVLFSGSALQYIDSRSFVYLTLNNAAGANLAGAVSVDSTLTLTNGLLILGTNNLSIGPKGIIGGTPSVTNMIIATGTGEMRKMMTVKGAFTFPIGDNTGAPEYSPATITYTSGTYAPGAYISMRVVNAKHPNNNAFTNYLNRYWIYRYSGITSGNYTTLFTYADGDIVGTESLIYGGRYRSSSTPMWTLLNAVTAAANTFSSASYNNDGDFTGSDRSCGIYNYRSKATGNWNAIASWEYSVDGGANWYASGSYPATVYDTVEIRNGHTIAGNLSTSPKVFIVDSGGIFNPSTGTIISGSGSLSGYGTIKVTRVSGTNELTTQYSITNRNLSNMTVEYNGATAQDVTATTYGGLVFTGTGVKTLNSGTATAKDISIVTGATFTNNGTIQIAGAITNAGTFTSTAGTVELNGTTPQTIPSATFSSNTVKNLTTNNNAGLTLADSLKITAVLKAATGTFATGNYLTLVSSASSTALIDGSGAGNVTGTVTMQRYLPSGFGYRYISSPFQASKVSELYADMNLADTFATLYKYIENVVHAGWVNYTDTSGILYPFNGYAANFGNTATPKTFDIQGIVNNGAQSISLSNNNKTYTSGFNLVGNPYPSPIDWNASSGWTKTNIDNAVYYFNNGTTDRYKGTYSSYVNGVSSDGVANNIIPSMQGFFVHVSNGAYPVTATLGCNNSVRVNNLTPTFHKELGNSVVPLVRISAGFTSDSAFSDPTVVYFDNRATDGFEQELDARKMMNTDDRVPSLYTLSGDEKLAISAVPDQNDDSREIPLGVKLARDGELEFKARDIATLPAGLHVYFADVLRGVIQDIEQIPGYKLRLEKGNYDHRFYLVFSRKDVVNIPGSEELNAYVQGQSIFVTLTTEKGDVVITNALGQVVKQEQLAGNGMHEIRLEAASGVYIVSMPSNKGRVSRKVYFGN